MFRTPAILALLLVMCRAAYANDQPSVDGSIEELLADLNADSFQLRMEAQKQIATLSPEQIGVLVTLATTAPPEAAVRTLHALGELYAEESPLLLPAVADGLEAFAASERDIVRNEARWLLGIHWRQRSELILQQLEEEGALIIRPETRERLGLGPNGVFGASPGLQIFLTSEWNAKADAHELLQRLPGLADEPDNQVAANLRFRRRFPLRGGTPSVVVFLVEGHTLTPEAVGGLLGAFGEVVQKRGRVMLGITSQPGVVRTGCHITSVTPFGSAEAGGLRNNDRITRVEGKPINSFDALVDALFQYSPGETINVELLRSSRLQQSPPEKIELPVQLKSWADYVRAINAASTRPADDDA